MGNTEFTSSNIDARYRILLILWFAFVVTISLLFGLTFLIQRSEKLVENDVLSWALMGIGASMAIVSVVVKQRSLTRAIESQRPDLVQSSYIIAFTLTEISSLIGLLMYMLLPGRSYYLMFMISAMFLVLHFPLREKLVAACFKQQF